MDRQEQQERNELHVKLAEVLIGASADQLKEIAQAIVDSDNWSQQAREQLAEALQQ